MKKMREWEKRHFKQVLQTMRSHASCLDILFSSETAQGVPPATGHVGLNAQREAPRHYYNHYPWQSRLVAQNLMERAEETGAPIFLFVGDIFHRFYAESIVKKLTDLASKGTNISILLPEKPADAPAFSKAFHRVGKNSNFSIKFMPRYDSSLHHLWLAGDAYRLEKPHAKHTDDVTETAPLRPARFAFNDPNFAGRLRDYRDDLLSRKDLQVLSV